MRQGFLGSEMQTRPRAFSLVGLRGGVARSVFILKFLLLGWESIKDFWGRSWETSQRTAEVQQPNKLQAGGISRPEGPPRLILKSSWMCPGAVQALSAALSTQTH